MLKRFSYKMRMNKHIKNLYILRQKMSIKSLKMTNSNKKTEGILLLGITNWYWGQKLFASWFDPLYVDLKWHKFTVGAQITAHVCQNLKNCRRNISAHRRRKKLRFFLFERTWASEWFKILTNLKIVTIVYT